MDQQDLRAKHNEEEEAGSAEEGSYNEKVRAYGYKVPAECFSC